MASFLSARLENWKSRWVWSGSSPPPCHTAKNVRKALCLPPTPRTFFAKLTYGKAMGEHTFIALTSESARAIFCFNDDFFGERVFMANFLFLVSKHNTIYEIPVNIIVQNLENEQKKKRFLKRDVLLDNPVCGEQEADFLFIHFCVIQHIIQKSIKIFICFITFDSITF